MVAYRRRDFVQYTNRFEIPPYEQEAVGVLLVGLGQRCYRGVAALHVRRDLARGERILLDLLWKFLGRGFPEQLVHELLDDVPHVVREPHYETDNDYDRDEKNEQANKVYAEIDKIRKDLNLGDGPSLKELKKEIDMLEFKQQTEVLTPPKERQLVDNIAKLTDELRRKKEQLEGSGELKSLLEKAQILRDEAAVHHNKVKEYAESAQQYHDKMIVIFKEADKIRAESDAAHKEFVKAQEAADEQHRLFIQSQKEIRELNKVIIGLKRKTKESKEESIREQTKKEAEEVYNQFKLGEKLNTEDLMLLQRSGLL